MNQEDIIKRLNEPFSFKEIEWKIQIKGTDNNNGMAVAYVDSRAIQRRLDNVVGPLNWKNSYQSWQTNAQLCGISIFCEERKEWITKCDGADNTDIEPIKGGLSDAFKRAAVLWGIGRYLYEMDGVWVDAVPAGKGLKIKQTEYGKLEVSYNKILAEINGKSEPQKSTSTPQTNTAKNPSQQASQQNPAQQTNQGESNILPFDYKVYAVKPSSKGSSLLELLTPDGEKINAYVKNSEPPLSAGKCLQNVDMVQKSSSYGPYNLINSYMLVA